MNPLPTELRNKLERTIVQARDVAEAGAKAALEALAVHHHEPYSHMAPEDRKLRNHLRARARQLGDKQNSKGELEITHLIWECAYEHWHRMLFARFLAENDLLIEPDMGVAISLEECEELAKEDGKDLWTLASELAQRMLPQIFRPDDPILKVMFAREHLIKLDRLLNDLEPTVFTSSDSLGWVYQFWQTKRKKEVNESGNKIGADELPAVTQLFTEPYMVNFLIHNTIGAWWAGRVLADKPSLAEYAKTEEELRKAVAVPGVSWDYLRFIKTHDVEGPWRPAAGTFENWPKQVTELRILDPSCGSGHFLVNLLYHLVSLLIAENGFKLEEAVDFVLQNNIYGLEIDERCTQLAAFALALASWTFPGASGYRVLPKIQIACSGIAPQTNIENWLRLSGKDSLIRNAMKDIFNLFKDSPILGSLINLKAITNEPLLQAGFNELQPILKTTVSKNFDNYDQWEIGISALGIASVIRIITKQYHLVITNVPYLASGKQTPILKNYLERYHGKAKQDLATAFVERSLDFCSNGGSIALVTPQNWLFLRNYKSLRINLLKENTWNFVSKLGSGAFETISGEIVNVILLSITSSCPEENNLFAGVDANAPRNPKEKDKILRADVGNLNNKKRLRLVNQKEQLSNPDAIINFEKRSSLPLLSDFSVSMQGVSPADYPRFGRCFWEIQKTSNWKFWQSSTEETGHYGGRYRCIWWNDALMDSVKQKKAYIRGEDAWGKRGVVVGQMSELPVSLYTGEKFDTNCAVIIPHNANHLPAIWCYCSSPRFNNEVRKVDQSIKVTNATLVKIPFDLKYWQEVAEKKYPNGLPAPYSENPTQWIFTGNIVSSKIPLQVSVARLLGYRWPGQKLDEIDKMTDLDGIVCIPSIRGEDPAAERLRSILQVHFGSEWTTNKEKELISETGSKTNDLTGWLQDDFIEQHCKLFRHRPFIWHIWDGRRRDGFHALVNYHKLAEGNGKGRQLLESLTYSYLGDWITRQKEGIRLGEGGAEDRLAAALELQKRLIPIIEGEPPFDIFVRWKPIEEQPIGWEPDINDGVRLNIRPFMAQDIAGGRKRAGILRWKPNIKWGKDRGKEPHRPQDQYPWFWKNGEFTGDRVNDIHLSINDKQKARKEKKQT